MEREHQIMAGQGAVMFTVLFFVAWQGGVHWLVAVFVGLLLMPPVLIAIEGVRHYVESREEDEDGEDAGTVSG